MIAKRTLAAAAFVIAAGTFGGAASAAPLAPMTPVGDALVRDGALVEQANHGRCWRSCYWHRGHLHCRTYCSRPRGWWRWRW